MRASLPSTTLQPEAGTLDSLILLAILLTIALVFVLVIIFWLRVRSRPHLTESRLATIMDTAPFGVLLVDRAGCIREANRACIELFGFGERLVGMQVDSLVPGRWRDLHARHRLAYMASPTPRAMGSGRDLACLHADGREIPVEIALTPLPNESAIMATVIDITERRRLQLEVEQHAYKLEQSNKELDSFAYIASHDLKSPLRGIHNLCQFIEEDLAAGELDQLDEHLQVMRGRVERMERLLEDLLSYSRAGRGEEKISRVDVSEIVGAILGTLDVPEHIAVTHTDLPVLETSRVALEQVLRNLIHNAIKHHDKDEGRIAITATGIECGKYFRFCVEDDGPGIEPEFRARVFRMFTTLVPRDEVEGSGIGLALVKKLVERYGGEIVIVDTESDVGVRFEFTWPKAMVS